MNKIRIYKATRAFECYHDQKHKHMVPKGETKIQFIYYGSSATHTNTVCVKEAINIIEEEMKNIKTFLIPRYNSFNLKTDRLEKELEMMKSELKKIKKLK